MKGQYDGVSLVGMVLIACRFVLVAALGIGFAILCGYHC